MSDFKQEQLDKLKVDFINRCSHPNPKDGFLEIPSKLEIKPEKSWLNETLSEKEVESFIETFNQEKSFLFGFKVERSDLKDIAKAEVFYSLPDEVFPEYAELHYPVIVKLDYLVATLNKSKSTEPFYFIPKVTLLQDFDGDIEVMKGKKTEDYADLLLLNFERVLDEKSDPFGYIDKCNIKEMKYVYQLRHNEKGTNVYNKLHMNKNNNGFKISMEFETGTHKTKEKAFEQASKWLKRLGRGIEIAEQINV